VGGGSITSAAEGEGDGSTTTSEGGIASGTLPRTGGGGFPISGLAGLLLAVGATLLLVLRRITDSE
jgi:LPXTG-motif cell wall-anchored protein